MDSADLKQFLSHTWRLPRDMCVRGLPLMLALTAAPAQAEFAICNQSFDVVNVAIGQDYGGVFRTEGWITHTGMRWPSVKA